MAKARPLLAAAALCGVALLGGCQSVRTTEAGAVGVDRQQAMLVSSQQMDSSATKAYQDVLGQAKKKNALNTDPVQVERVRAVANRLIPQTAHFRKDAPAWKWEVNVLTSKEVNAWCMPGGKIAFYTGILEQLKMTDDEIAAVMGHEIAHALREHGRERASQAMVQGIGLQILGAAVGMSGGAMDLTHMVMEITLSYPNSRTHETEADRIGVELAARAGYDPRAAVNVWQKMQKLGGGQPPQILSTHPSHETRIKDLGEYSERVLPIYEQARPKK